MNRLVTKDFPNARQRDAISVRFAGFLGDFLSMKILPPKRLLVLAIIVGLPLFSAIAQMAVPAQLGDLDADGQPTVLDLVRLLKHIDGTARLGSEPAVFADLNQDGFVNQTDVDLLTDAILGLSALPILPPTRILSTSPSHGESGIAVTREMIVRLSQPLSSNVVLTVQKFHADFGARRFLSRVEVSNDRRTLTLFYLENLSGSTRVKVTLEGNTLLDFAGRPIDADGDGQPGGTAFIEFETLGLTPNPDSVVCGRVFASQLATNAAGTTNQSINTPLPGVIITADGLEERVRAVTDAFGNFRITNAPAGEFFVHIDGRAVTNLGAGIRYPDLAYYPFVGKRWTSIAGREVNIGEVYLPLVPSGTLISVSASADTVINFPASVVAANPALAGVALTVPANSLFSDNGTRGGRVGIAAVPPDRLPSPLPEGLSPALVITVQTDGGQNFSQPVPACFPNLPDPRTGAILAPGAKTALWSFNHDSGQWEVVGPMTVSPDGRYACTDPGVGIRQPGWHFPAPGTSGGGGPNGPQPRDPQKENGLTTEKPPGTPGGMCPPPPSHNATPLNPQGPTDPVYYNSGEFVHQETDLQIKGVGTDFNWVRTYRSHYDPGTHTGERQDIQNVGYTIGGGWDFSYNIYIAGSAGSQLNLYLHSGNVRRDLIFRVRDNWAGQQGIYSGGRYGDVVWVQNGLPYELRQDTNDQSFRLTFPDQGFWEFRPLSFRPNARNYIYPVARISRIVDRNGNVMRFHYDQEERLQTIVDTLGRSNHVAYIATPGADYFRISSLTDFSGRTVRYEYDGQNRDFLTAVTSPAINGTVTANDFPNGKRTTYAYQVYNAFEQQSVGYGDSRLYHNLTAITDGRRNDPSDPAFGQGSWLVNEYGTAKLIDELYNVRANGHGPVTFDRVVRQRWGRGTVEIHSELYLLDLQAAQQGLVVDVGTLKPTPNAPYFNPSATHTGEPEPSLPGYGTRSIVRDRMGNVTEYIYDGLNQCRRFIEYTGRSATNAPVTYAANKPAGKLRPTDPDSYITEYEYDAQSNPIVTRQPKGNGESRTYEQLPRSSRNLTRRDRQPFQVNGQPFAAQSVISEAFQYDSQFGSCCGFNHVVAQTDGRGNTVTNQYDDRGNLTNRIHRLPTITEQWEYNARGQVTRHVHPDNGSGHRRVDIFNYYESGSSFGYLREEIIDSGGFNLTTRYEYDLVGNVTRKTDPRGHDTQYLYNQIDQVIREISREVRDGSGVRYQRNFHYDANNNVKRTEVLNLDENGNGLPNTRVTTTFEYDILNMVTRKTEEISASRTRVTEYDYDANENLIEVRYGEAAAGRQSSNRVRYEYDERNLLFRETRAPGTPEESTTQYDYDGNKNLVRITEGLQAAAPRVTTMLHDGYDRLISKIDPMGNVTTYGYDANDNLISTRVDGQLVDAPGTNGNARLSEVTFGYDALNRLTNTTAAFFNPATQTAILGGTATTRVEYNGLSQVIRMVNANGHETLIAYDTANRRRTLTDARGNSITLDYDANNNLIAQTETEKPDLGGLDELFTTAFAYDNLDRLIQTVNNANTTNRFGYDSRHNRTVSVDGRGNVVRYAFDDLDRLTDTLRQMTDTGDGSGGALGTIATRQTWDDTGRLTAQIDDNNNATTYVYDGLNRRAATVFADGTGQTNRFDPLGNPVLFTDANGNRVTNTFDLAGRVTRKDIVPGPGVSADTTFEVFQYDGLSRIVRAEDNDAVVLMAYDSLGRVIADVQNGLTVGSVFDPVGNMLACLYPGGRAVTNTFDELERLKTVGDADGVIATYAYVGPGRVKQRDYKNGVRMTYAYDGITGVPNPAGDFGVKQITRTTHARIADAVVLDDRAYTWDRAGNKTSHSELHSGGAQRAYAYDSVSRLIRSVRTPAAGAPETITYNLDGVGNRTSVTGGTNAGAYTLSATGPEPADRPMNQYTATPFDTRSYDRNGNQTAMNPGLPDARTLAYDYRNRMVTFTNGSAGVTTRYAYDALGRRIQKQATGPSAEDTRFVQSGWRVVEERTAGNATAANYVHGGYVDELVEMRRDGQSYYYGIDDVYSVVLMTSSSGTSVEEYSFSDFGFPAQSNGSVSGIRNRYLFTGREFEDSPSMLFYRTRYADGVSGSFLSRDAIGGWGDEINLGHSRQFLGHNPHSRLDPDGNLAFPLVLLGMLLEMHPLIHDLLGALGPPDWSPLPGGQCLIDQAERDKRQRDLSNMLMQTRPGVEKWLVDQPPSGPVIRSPEPPWEGTGVQKWKQQLTERFGPQIYGQPETKEPYLLQQYDLDKDAHRRGNEDRPFTRGRQDYRTYGPQYPPGWSGQRNPIPRGWGGSIAPNSGRVNRGR